MILNTLKPNQTLSKLEQKVLRANRINFKMTKGMMSLFIAHHTLFSVHKKQLCKHLLFQEVWNC
ncbi:Uncharacterised protein [Streptococcus porcinus]|nr:Uncharacterised protein [Streptococcus porcinus]